jgi:hypothetical protein
MEQDGCQGFERDRIGEGPGVERSQPEVADQAHHQREGRGVVRAHEHVAVDRVLGIREVNAAHVVQPSDDLGLLAQQGLRLERGGLARRQRHLADLRWSERHRDVDEHLVLEMRFELGQRGAVRGVGHREHGELAGARRPGVFAAGDPQAVRRELLRARTRFVRVARSDQDLVSRACPAQREATPFLASSADQPNTHAVSLPG